MIEGVEILLNGKAVLVPSADLDFFIDKKGATLVKGNDWDEMKVAEFRAAVSDIDSISELEKIQDEGLSKAGSKKAIAERIEELQNQE